MNISKFFRTRARLKKAQKYKSFLYEREMEIAKNGYPVYYYGETNGNNNNVEKNKLVECTLLIHHLGNGEFTLKAGKGHSGTLKSTFDGVILNLVNGAWQPRRTAPYFMDDKAFESIYNPFRAKLNQIS